MPQKVPSNGGGIPTKQKLFLGVPAAALVAVLLLAPAAGAAAAPPGYATLGTEELGTGVTQTALVRRAPDQVVHVARIARGAPFTLRAVVAQNVVSSATPERTSAICQRLACLAAVNGDFFVPETGEPVGGVVAAGQLLRSPSSAHHQLLISPKGKLSAGPMTWRGTLVPTDLRSVGFDGVNVQRPENAVVLYSPSYGVSTRTNPFGVELILRVVRPRGPLTLGHTSVVRMVELRKGGDSLIPGDGAVLSAHGSGARSLNELWARFKAGEAAPDALLRLESQPEATESIGGSPVLVRDGRPWFSDAATNFVRGRHPRTIVGRTKSDDILLVTVDGRQPGYSEGISLAEAAQLMIDLGAVEAINLDGGGSTTFVARGQVVNKPSDRLVRRLGRQHIVHLSRPGEAILGNVERPVAVALVLVPRGTGAGSQDAKALLQGIQLPRALALEVPQSSDPASDPSGSLPAIVAGSRNVDPILVAVAMLLFVLAVVAATGIEPRLRRRFRAQPQQAR